MVLVNYEKFMENADEIKTFINNCRVKEIRIKANDFVILDVWVDTFPFYKRTVKRLFFKNKTIKIAKKKSKQIKYRKILLIFIMKKLLYLYHRLKKNYMKNLRIVLVI